MPTGRVFVERSTNSVSYKKRETEPMSRWLSAAKFSHVAQIRSLAMACCSYATKAIPFIDYDLSKTRNIGIIAHIDAVRFLIRL